uniref:Uncharacterized protein n=1 Tax=Kalanchoe fedtschenkoi TaxID=63787 RepID=A0A7N0T8G7_KALFE
MSGPIPGPTGSTGRSGPRAKRDEQQQCSRRSSTAATVALSVSLNRLRSYPIPIKSSPQMDPFLIHRFHRPGITCSEAHDVRLSEDGERRRSRRGETEFSGCGG